MITQLLFAFALSSATVAIHALGTVFVVMPIAGVWRKRLVALRLSQAVIPLTRLVGMLLLLHVAEMFVWAAAYAAASVFPDFETSLYFSLTSYTTVSYGDVLPQKDWRLVGPLEAAVGVLMLGWSTGIIVAALQYIATRRLAETE
jgi:hypothetical protein